MKFLILTQYFYPEVGAPQVRLAAFAREIRRLGHEVEVVTALPNYPTGRIFSEYKGKFYVREEWEGVTVHRIWLYPSTGTGIKRILNYLSFAVTSLWGLSKAQRPDYIFVESPPLFLGLSAWLASRLWRVRFIFNVADLWPDSVKELKLMSNGALLRLAEALEHWSYQQAAYVTSVTEGIEQTLIMRKRVQPEKLLFLPNGVDTELFKPSEPKLALAQRLGILGKKIFIYSGTIGIAQCLEVVLGAAKRLADRDDILFLLVGDGSAKVHLKNSAIQKKLRNILFLDPMPLSAVAELYSFGYAGIATLCNKPLFEGARPSKLLPIMASGKPVIYSGSGEGARLVEEAKAGIVVTPEDPVALAEAVCKLLEHPTLAEEFGRNGRRYVEQNLSWPSLVKNWLEQLEGRRGGGVA